MARYPDLLIRCAVALALVFAGVIAWRYAFAVDLIDPIGTPVGGDFMAFYAAGSLAADGQPLAAYDDAAMRTRLAGLIAADDDPFFPWFYPPAMFALLEPLARLPYAAAFGLWTACGVVAGGAAAFALSGWRGAALLFAAPVTAVSIMHGQTGLLTAAALVGALALLEKRPLLAGLIAGLVTLKPHYAVLFPLAALVAARPTALIGYAASAGALALAGLATAGVGGYLRWLERTGEATAMLEAGFPVEKLASVYVALARVGVPEPVAMAVHALAALAGAGVALALLRRTGPTAPALAAVAVASTLISPYAWDYDLVIWAMAAVLLAGWCAQRGVHRRVWLALAALAMAPAALGPTGVVGMPLGPLAAAGFLALCWILAAPADRREPAAATA
jgi:alpha-1,2-mannosyltransferase